MKMIRVSTILALVLAAASGAMLFLTAQKVYESEAELRRLKQAAAREEQTIRVLRAEWDYLNRPDRLESIAKDHLDLVPPGEGNTKRNLPGVEPASGESQKDESGDAP